MSQKARLELVYKVSIIARLHGVQGCGKAMERFTTVWPVDEIADHCLPSQK